MWGNIFATHLMDLVETDLQIRFSSHLVLKLAVCPLQDIYSGLTDMDPQSWRISKDKSP